MIIIKYNNSDYILNIFQTFFYNFVGTNLHNYLTPPGYKDLILQ